MELWTWSDRGVSSLRTDHLLPRRNDRGPVMRLIDHCDVSYRRATVLTTAAGQARAEALVEELKAAIGDARCLVLDVQDPSDHAQLFRAVGNAVADAPRCDVLLSAGTPQAQTIWVVLVKAGLLDARMLQVIPPAFVPVPHPHPLREVALDFEGFPRIVALRAEVEQLRAASKIQGLVGSSAPMHALGRRIARVAARPDVPLLIVGETGSGKELVATAVHRASPRATGPFVAENCGAIPEGTLNSELFGHQKGSFTGASRDRQGLFAMAHGGTLFLDEIAELPLRFQAHLLRVLQDGRFRPVGSERTHQVDVRLITATHRDLRAMIAEGSFREDLYYRLCGAVLAVPPLRERTEDIPRLVSHFLREADSALVVTPDAMQIMQRRPWPGNVRQLRAEVQRWTIFCDDQVQAHDVAPTAAVTPAPVADSQPTLTLAEAVAEVERTHIRAALRDAQGNLSQAARRLGIDRNTLKRKLARYELR